MHDCLYSEKTPFLSLILTMMPLLEEILVEIVFTFINANIYYTYNDYFL